MDQVVLEIPSKWFHVTDSRAFEPEYYPVRPDGFKPRKFVGSLRPKGYFPQITINGRPNRILGYQFTLKIQVSVPKLLYGNNLQMVNVEDEDRFYTILKQKYY